MRGKWDLLRVYGKNTNPILGLERRNTKENGIYPEFAAGILTQYWERRNMKENGIYPEVVAGILPQY